MAETKKAPASKTTKTATDKDQDNKVEAQAADVGDRASKAVADAVQYARDAAHASVGFGLIVQEQISERRTENTERIQGLFDQAKVKGEAKMTEIQDRIDTVMSPVKDRFQPIADRFEASIPSQVTEAIETQRERVRNLISA